ncbi:MAG TPA: hypothetical protein VES42_19640 [Pilimelia sp.]|nr:hypothetical protein [Pilimelia sp.]
MTYSWRRRSALILVAALALTAAVNSSAEGAAAAGTAAVGAAAVGAAAAGAAAAGAPVERRLAVWNHDLELGANGAAPTRWSAAPASPTATLKAVRVDAPAPMPRYTGERTVNHAIWLSDRSGSGAVAARAAAVPAAAGRTYWAQAQVYVGAGTTARLNLEFLDAAGRRLPGGLVEQGNLRLLPKAGELTWVRSTGVAPAGTTAIRALIVSAMAAVGSSYWDQLFLAEVAAPPAYAPALGTGAVLFVGDHRVGQLSGLTRVVQPGRKYRANGDPRAATPVYDSVCCHRGGQPPHSAQLFGTVLHEDGVYKMWYTAKASGPWSARYAESADGRSFPAGAQVLADVWVAGVVRNPKTTDPSRRYLMLGVKGAMAPATTTPMPPVDVTYRAYASPDGKAWTPLAAAAVLPMRDVANVSYDPVTARFVATTKQAGGTTDRQAYVSTSADFVHWTAPRQALRVDAADPAGSHVYGAPVFRYGDQLLGLPLIYTQGLVNGVNGPVVPQIAASPDGSWWSRPSRSPLIPLGAAGELDDGFLMLASAPVVDGDRVRLYYSGWDAGHETAGRSSRVFYAEWRRDGFVSLRAGAGGGTLTTKPLRPTGTTVTVNADLTPGTGVAGQLTAEVLDAGTGVVIPGYGTAQSTVVAGDTLAGSLTWAGKNLSALAGRQIRLRFTLTAGDFYSFRVG